MFEHLDQIKTDARRANRAIQEGLSALILFLGALLLVILALLLPDMLKGTFSGDAAAPKAFLTNVAAVGLCWLQWRYRHVVYPPLRRPSPETAESCTVQDFASPRRASSRNK